MSAEKIAVMSGLALVAIALLGLINAAIGASVNSPNGSFQNHLNTVLLGMLLIPGLTGLVAVGVVVLR